MTPDIRLLSSIPAGFRPAPRGRTSSGGRLDTFRGGPRLLCNTMLLCLFLMYLGRLGAHDHLETWQLEACRPNQQTLPIVDCGLTRHQPYIDPVPLLGLFTRDCFLHESTLLS